MELIKKRCVPCEGNTPRVTDEQMRLLLPEVPGWMVRDGGALERRFSFKDFVGAMTFVNRMAQLAEDEGHHPDFAVHYNVVDVTLSTHAIGGLSENDFILAAKINLL